jgi:hypothetical protein
MPIGKADYQIEIRSTADNAGFEAANEALGKLGERAGEAGVSTKEVHESIELIKDIVGQALGPLGEMVHLLGNPLVLAIGGLSVAYHLLAERRKEDIENMEKQIELLHELTASFHDNHIKAVVDASDALNKYNLEVKAAQNGVDYLTEAMKRQIAVSQQQSTAMEGQLTTTVSLWEANIKLAQAEGKMDAPTADAMLRHAKDLARSKKEEVDYASKQSEIDEKTERAGQASGESAAAKGKLPALAITRRTQDEIVKDAQDAIERAKKSLDDANDAFFHAQAKANAPGLIPTSPDEWEHVDQLRDAASTAQDSYDKSQKYAEKQKERLDQIDADIEEQKKIYDSRRQLAESLAEEAHEQKKALERLQKSNAANDALDNQLETTTALTALVDAVKNGSATPGQQAELAGSQTTSPAPMLKDIATRAAAIHKEANSPQKTAETEALLGRILGLLDAITLHPGLRNAADMQRQLNVIEQQLSVSGNVR